MRRVILFAWLIAAAATMLALMPTIGSNPAAAFVRGPDMRSVKPALTQTHCKRTYHCFWDTQYGQKYRRCHVCG